MDADDPTVLHGEQPYLIYPIGTVDDDPETLIDFHGTSPRPIAQNGYKRNRALVTIEFFELDNPDSRKNLYRDRALIVIALYSLLEKTTAGTATERADAVTQVENVLKSQLRHLNCARSFNRLFAADPGEARAVRDSAFAFMISIS